MSTPRDRCFGYERERARATAAEARVQELLNDIRRLRSALRKAEIAKSTPKPLPEDGGKPPDDLSPGCHGRWAEERRRELKAPG